MKWVLLGALVASLLSGLSGCRNNGADAARVAALEGAVRDLAAQSSQLSTKQATADKPVVPPKAAQRETPSTLWTLVIVVVTAIGGLEHASATSAVTTVQGIPSRARCLAAGKDVERNLVPLGGSAARFVCVEVVESPTSAPPEPSLPPPDDLFK